MKALAFAASAVLVSPFVSAQNWFVPDNLTASGTCNVIPFGSSSTTSSFYNQRYQCKATAADLGSTANLITGIGFSPCSSGVATYGMLEVTFDHHPAGSPLDPTFDNNLTPAAVTVLMASNFTWNLTADVWNEMGLQDVFVYNGVDDLVVDIKATDAIAPSGFHRDTRQRLYWFANSGPAAPSGTLGNAALKFEISMLTAKLSSYGTSCAGSNGTPVHTLGGSSQLGGTADLDVSSGAPNALSFCVFGFYNGAPFPLDLTAQGMPGCLQYIGPDLSIAVLLDAAGNGSLPFPVPNNGNLVNVRFFTQYAILDPAANAAGIVSTNYGRVYVGN